MRRTRTCAAAVAVAAVVAGAEATTAKKTAAAAAAAVAPSPSSLLLLPLPSAAWRPPASKKKEKRHRASSGFPQKKIKKRSRKCRVTTRAAKDDTQELSQHCLSQILRPGAKAFFSFSRKITLSFSWEWRAVEEQQQQQRRHSTAPPCHTSRHGGDGPTERLFFLFPYPPHTSDRHANNECALSRLLSLVREIRPTPKQSCKSAE